MNSGCQRVMTRSFEEVAAATMLAEKEASQNCQKSFIANEGQKSDAPLGLYRQNSAPLKSPCIPY